MRLALEDPGRVGLLLVDVDGVGAGGWRHLGLGRSLLLPSQLRRLLDFKSINRTEMECFTLVPSLYQRLRALTSCQSNMSIVGWRLVLASKGIGDC